MHEQTDRLCIHFYLSFTNYYGELIGISCNLSRLEIAY
jgi:hypothetical protein